MKGSEKNKIPSWATRHPTMCVDLYQNSQAVKKIVQPSKSQGERKCEIQGAGQEMAVMVG